MSWFGRFAAALALFLLAACAGAPSDPTPRVIATTAVMPHLTGDNYVAIDGAALPMRRWIPQHAPVKAVILAVHGFNDYSYAFSMPAKIWAEHGIATYAYDQRGFGAAPDPGSWAGTYLLDSDVAAISRLLRARYPGVPLYLLGESMGGAVAITAEAGSAGAERPDVDGVILVAPAVWGVQTMNVFLRATLWLADHIAPRWTLTGSGLHILASDNIPMLREMGRDPLVIKATRVDTIRGLVQLMSQAYDDAPLVKRRMLLLYGGQDELVPETPVRKFAAALPPGAPGTPVIAWYDQGYHMLLRDLDGQKVAQDVESWIFHPAAALPSGADIAGAEKLLPQTRTLSARLGPVREPRAAN